MHPAWLAVYVVHLWCCTEGVCHMRCLSSAHCCLVLCRTWHLGNLIKVRGVVTRRSGVFPQLSLVKWDCGRCGTTMGPFVVGDNADEVKPKQCVACQAKGGFTVSMQACTNSGTVVVFSKGWSRCSSCAHTLHA